MMMITALAMTARKQTRGSVLCVEATEAVTKASSDPQARLRAIFEAKMRGDM